jgi:hypothetical protein
MFLLEVENLHIDAIQELQTAANFINNLVLSAENVSIVLLESAYTRQARQSTAQLISKEEF